MDAQDRLFGEIAVRLQLLTHEQVAACVAAQESEGRKRRIGELALSLGLLNQDDVELVLAQQERVLSRRREASKQRQPAVSPAAEPVPPPPAAPAGPASIQFHATMIAQAAPPVDAEQYDFGAGGEGARAVAAPLDRGWRNPSRPPATEPSPAPIAEVRRAAAATVIEAKASWLASAVRRALEAGASDLYLQPGQRPQRRVDGRLEDDGAGPTLGDTELATTLAELMRDAAQSQWLRRDETCFAHTLAGLARLRVHACRTERGLDIALRLLPLHAGNLVELGLPARLSKLLEASRGLFLIAGPPGSGRSSTLAACVQELLQARGRHVVLLEAPAELSEIDGAGLLERREVPADVPSLAAGLAQGLRTGADVIAVSDLDDHETIAHALSAANAGALVLGCVRAASTGAALAGVLGGCTEARRPELAGLLADALRATLFQRLLPQAIGRGRVPAIEVLVGTAGVAQLVRDQRFDGIGAAIQAGKPAGMLAFDDSLDALAATGTITADEARRVAHKKDRRR